MTRKTARIHRDSYHTLTLIFVALLAFAALAGVVGMVTHASAH